MRSILTADQARVFAFIKKARVCTRADIQRELGLTQTKLSKALALFFVVDKLAEINGTLYFCESPLPQSLRAAVAQATQVNNDAPIEAAAPAALTSQPLTLTPAATEAPEIEAEVVAAPSSVPSGSNPPTLNDVLAKVKNKAKPSSLEEVINYLKELSDPRFYSYLSSPGTDYESTAQQFINYFEAKGWLYGKGPLKDWRAALRRYTSDAQNHWIVRKFQGYANGFVSLDAERDAAIASDYTMIAAPQIAASEAQPATTPAPATPAPAAPLPCVPTQSQWMAEETDSRRHLIEVKYAALYGPAPREEAPEEEKASYAQARNSFVDMVLRDCEHMTYSELMQLDVSNWAAAS